MDIKEGRFVTDDNLLREMLEKQSLTGEQLVAFFEVGERVEIKGAWFEVTKLLTRKRQRVVLKPIPKP